jgi:hypothetical protein
LGFVKDLVLEEHLVFVMEICWEKLLAAHLEFVMDQ